MASRMCRTMVGEDAVGRRGWGRWMVQGKRRRGGVLNAGRRGGDEKKIEKKSLAHKQDYLSTRQPFWCNRLFESAHKRVLGSAQRSQGKKKVMWSISM